MIADPDVADPDVAESVNRVFNRVFNRQHSLGFCIATVSYITLAVSDRRVNHRGLIQSVCDLDGSSPDRVIAVRACNG